MANNTTVNKVVYGNSVLIDLTSDTITANDLKSGVTAHNAAGEAITGSAVVGGGIDITITTEQSSLFGTTVTITKGQQTFTSTFNNAGVALFENLDIDGAIVVTDANGSTYNFTVKSSYSFSVGTLNYISWLEAANIDSTGYSSLSDVLEDEVAIRQLMSLYAPVDYLATAKAGDPMVQTIINNDLCAKWITLRAYAEDTLSANASIKALMDSAGKYGYGEWALMPQVPKMTSNTAPYGVASADSELYANNYYRYAYYAFSDDSNDGNAWISNTGVSNGWLQYAFPSPIIAKKMLFSNQTEDAARTNSSFIVQGSNDGTNFTNIKTFTDLSDGVKELSLEENATAYLYYRIQFTAANNTWSGGTCRCKKLQFYAWQPKGNVPVMIGASAPYGETIENNHYQSNYAYYAFDNDASNYWHAPLNTSNSYVGYKFTNPVCVRKTKLIIAGNGLKKYKIQGSNDGFVSDINDLFTSDAVGSTTAGDKYILEDSFNNNAYYLYYRLLVVESWQNDGTAYVNELQFYGRELKVSVPKMTADNTPYGEASGSHNWSGLSDNNAFVVFDGTESGDGYRMKTNGYIIYKFNLPTKIYKVTQGFTWIFHNVCIFIQSNPNNNL